MLKFKKMTIIITKFKCKYLLQGENGVTFFIWLDDEVHPETIEFDWFCNMIKDKLDIF